jgi:hypothetical protein
MRRAPFFASTLCALSLLGCQKAEPGAAAPATASKPDSVVPAAGAPMDSTSKKDSTLTKDSTLIKDTTTVKDSMPADTTKKP